MVNETTGRPRLTPKGERTRARIVEEAAVLIHERGVAGTTLDDVKAAAEVSGSQLYHYFPTRMISCRRSSTTRPTPPSVTSGTRISAARKGSKPGGTW